MLWFYSSDYQHTNRMAGEKKQKIWHERDIEKNQMSIILPLCRSSSQCELRIEFVYLGKVYFWFGKSWHVYNVCMREFSV